MSGRSANAASSACRVVSDVERLLSQARTAGLPVGLVRDGAPRELPLVVQRAAYGMINVDISGRPL
jgi:hypothetical protein